MDADFDMHYYSTEDIDWGLPELFARQFAKWYPPGQIVNAYQLRATFDRFVKDHRRIRTEGEHMKRPKVDASNIDILAKPYEELKPDERAYVDAYHEARRRFIKRKIERFGNEDMLPEQYDTPEHLEELWQAVKQQYPQFKNHKLKYK